MAWNTKYYTEFRNENNDLFRLNLEIDGYSGSVIELQAGENPIEVVSDKSELIDASIGSGMTVNLISATSLQLIDLNVVSAFAVRVSLLKNSILVWRGWLNPEEYSETYSEYANYDVTFTASDGVAKMNDIKFVDVNGARIIGMYSAFDIILKCFEKVKLTDIYLSIADQFELWHLNNSITHTASQTYLHTLIVNADNYIDEKGESMTCRDVLDGILLAMGLTMRNNIMSSTLGAGFTIFDSNVVVSTTNVLFKRYTITGSFTYSTNIATSDFKFNIEDDILYNGSGSTMSYTKTVNKVEVITSNYQLTDVLKADIEEDDVTYFTYYERTSGCTNENRWSEWIYSDPTNFTMIDSSMYTAQKVAGVGSPTSASVPVVTTDELYLARILPASSITYAELFKTNVDSALFFKTFSINTSDYSGLALLTNFDFMVEKDKCSNADEVEYNAFSMIVRVSCGSSTTYSTAHFGKTGAKLDTGTWYQPETNRDDANDESKGFLTSYITIPQIDTVVEPGLVEIAITTYSMPFLTGGTYRIKFKNFSVKVVNYIEPLKNLKYKEFSSNVDLVETGTVDNESANDAKTINIIHGTGLQKGIERCSFMYEGASPGAYFRIIAISKGNASVKQSYEKWLISKVLSNHYTPSVVLDNMTMKASTLDLVPFSRITDTDRFVSKIFMITGWTYKPYDNDIILSLQEINKDTYKSL